MFAGDGLPSQVCERCVHRVNESFNFKLQCEGSDATLRQFVRSQGMEVNRYILFCILYELLKYVFK
jgi:hypothetical protein